MDVVRHAREQLRPAGIPGIASASFDRQFFTRRSWRRARRGTARGVRVRWAHAHRVEVAVRVRDPISQRCHLGHRLCRVAGQKTCARQRVETSRCDPGTASPRSATRCAARSTECLNQQEQIERDHPADESACRPLSRYKALPRSAQFDDVTRTTAERGVVAEQATSLDPPTRVAVGVLADRCGWARLLLELPDAQT